MNLKHQQELLQQIAAGVKENDDCRVRHLRVVIHTDTQHFFFGLAQALDALANDLYWDERGNWADARRATVETY